MRLFSLIDTDQREPTVFSMVSQGDQLEVENEILF